MTKTLKTEKRVEEEEEEEGIIVVIIKRVDEWKNR